MSLSGSLTTMPLPDLLQWLDSAHKTGTLVLEGPDYSTTLFIKEGRVISSASKDPRSYFGQFLLAHTDLSEEDLRRGFDLQEKTKVYLGKNIYIKTMLGKILVNEKILGEEDVRRVLRIKAEETIYPAFLWADGSFRFLADELPPEELVPLSLDIVEVLNRGIQRMEEWANIRARVPSNDATFKVNEERLPPGLSDEDFAAQVLRELRTQRTLRDIILSLHSTEFAVNRTVFHFLEQGWVTLDREQPSQPPPLHPPTDSKTPSQILLERSRQHFDERAYAETVIVARQAVKGDPANTAARELLAQSEQQLTDSYYATYFSRSDIPYLTEKPNPVDTALRSAEERFLIERVNGEWPFRALIHLSPLKEVDAVAIFKKLIEEGVIAVRKGPPSSPVDLG